MFFSNRIKSISPKDKVLEIGPGGTPHERADVFLDIDPKYFRTKLEESQQRGSAPKLITEKPIIYYDGRAFPFKDNEFDYVICSHVLEHVDDLKFFLQELFRITKRGYIEYPTVLYEYLYNIPVHYNYLKYSPRKNTLHWLKKSSTPLDYFKPIQAYYLETLANGHTRTVDDLIDYMMQGFEWNKPFALKQVKSIEQVMPDIGKVSPPPKPHMAEHAAEILTDKPNLTSYTRQELTKELVQRAKRKPKSLILRLNRYPSVNQALQKKRFEKISPQFNANHQAINKLGYEPFLMPFWKNVNKKIEPTFLPTPKFDFLNDRAIIDTMFVDGSKEWINAQTDYVKSKLGKDFKKVLREDSVGNPKKFEGSLSFTSHNTLHHTYHILYYLEQTNQDISSIGSVVEWGGGYGNFAKLWWRLKNTQTTYTIIDSSLFCAIQWLYLTSVLGSASVNLIKEAGQKIQHGKINIVPLALLNQVDINGELFVSTWGLSESMASAQDYVIKERNWFGAQHFLIGYQDSTKDLKHASRLGQLSKKEGAKIIDIKFIPNNHYALK